MLPDALLPEASLKPQLEDSFLVPKISGSFPWPGITASQADMRNPGSTAHLVLGRAGRPEGHENSLLSPRRSDCWVGLTFCLPTQSWLR